MASELLSLLLWANATLGVGILFVFALRVPVRRFAGARVAYALWLVPLLAFLAWLAPARQVTLMIAPTVAVEAAENTMVAAAPELPEVEIFIVTCWLIGVGGTASMFALRQRGFVQSAGLLEPIAELGRGVFRAAPSHGPAVVGALRPVIVLPRDFGARFSPEEQELVLAHERAHLDRFDPMINAAAMGLRAVNWFNPLVHVAARALRIDQELACDAAVLARHAGVHRVYAEAMLKSHAAAFDIPVGCAWHTAAFHPLKERILMLKSSPSRLSRSLGLSFVAAAAFGVCGTVWLMRPVDVSAAPTQEEPFVVTEVDEAAADSAQEAAREAQAAAQDAMREAREAQREAAAQVRLAMRDAREAAREARRAIRDAAPAIAAAKRAIKDAQPAIAAARREAAIAVRQAMRDAAPAIAAAQRAINDAQPAIAAARREAERHARDAIVDARRAERRAALRARLATACGRAQARPRDLDASNDADLRALADLVCIPWHLERPAD